MTAPNNLDRTGLRKINYQGIRRSCRNKIVLGCTNPSMVILKPPNLLLKSCYSIATEEYKSKFYEENI